MSLVATASAKALELVLDKALTRALDLGWRKFKWLPITAVRPESRVRISCSAFLRIKDEDQRYLLIRNLHRTEFYGPLGGCFKYYESAAGMDLAKFLYLPDDSVLGKDSVRDLRGYIRRGSTAKFFEWFISGRDARESARECLSREIEEEIFGECKFQRPADYVQHELDVSFVRSYLERSAVPGRNVLQFRHFEIYDLALSSDASRLLSACLRKQRSNRLIWASRKDVEVGRTAGGKTIGHAATLLVADKITRSDLPPHR